MISTKQTALIHLAKKQLGLDEETYRAILAAYGGVGSARDLDLEGFDRVMAYLKKLGFESTWSKRTFGDRRGMASPSQVDLIRHLWREWSDHPDDGAGLNHWLGGHFGVSALRFLDPAGAQKAIPALRAMNKRKLAKAAGEPLDA